MKSRFLTGPFIVSLIIIPAAFALVLVTGGTTQADRVTQWLFLATALVEIAALTQVIITRRLFLPSDRLHTTWTLIAAFLIVRLAAEVRLATMSLHLVPGYNQGSSPLLFFYIVVLRYLYTLSDILLISALITMVRAYRSSGLKFELMRRDYLYIALVWSMPMITYIFRANLSFLALGMGTDNYIATYRSVAVFIGALIASLCLVIRRYVSQMGGGAVARVWSAVVIAGIARDASFLAFALILTWWKSGAQFAEQYLLWVFSGCWLIAAVYQQEVLPKPKAAPAPAAAAGVTGV